MDESTITMLIVYFISFLSISLGIIKILLNHESRLTRIEGKLDTLIRVLSRNLNIPVDNNDKKGSDR